MYYTEANFPLRCLRFRLLCKKTTLFYKKVLTKHARFAIIVVVSDYGEMSEWLKEPVLKTGSVRALAGSNPALSSILFHISTI